MTIRRTAPFPLESYHQQRLTWLLKQQGYPHGWAAWIQEQRAKGLSGQRIAYQIFALTGLQVDQSTVSQWVKQLEAAGKAPT